VVRHQGGPVKEDGSARLDGAVRSYYERSPEEERLSQGSSQIEAERTRSVSDAVMRWLAAP
jgi:hypothetical protein